MQRLSIRISALLMILLAACNKDATTAAIVPVKPADTTTVNSTTPTSVAISLTQQAVTVGIAFDFDATQGGHTFTDPSSRGLTYAVSFSPSANGLTSTGGHVTGIPANACVTSVTITATDALGRTASSTFALVAFASDLLAPVLPSVSYRYSDADVPLPPHFKGGNVGGGVVSGADNMPATNRTTNAGATLSANDRLACASCHVQALGFGDTARLSRGFLGGFTGRHGMALSNSRFYAPGKFFWDERAATLEAQVLQPIQNTVEMGMTLDALVNKIALTPFYRPLFVAAFGSEEITSDRVSLALAQFVRSLISSQSKYDAAFTANPPRFPDVLTPQEAQGEQIFSGQGNCSRCHGTAIQIADQPRNNGLDATVTDIGAGNARFKVPSLRNIAVRPPFMHDGRFTTLAQVIDFYDHGVNANANLDNVLRNPDGSAKRLNLNPAQRAALEAFLRTLTDNTFLTDPRLSSPFAR